MICPARNKPSNRSSPPKHESAPSGLSRRTQSHTPAGSSPPLPNPAIEADHRLLHIDRHARGHPVHIDLVRVQPFRLQENLVPRLVRELHDLVLDGRTVPRPNALNLPAVQRRPRRCSPAESDASPPLCRRCGTAPVGRSILLVQERKRRRLRIPVLRLETATSQSSGHPAAAASRSSAASTASPRFRKLIAEQVRRRLAVPAAAVLRSPTCAKPFRNVPVVTTTASAVNVRPSAADSRYRRTPSSIRP